MIAGTEALFLMRGANGQGRSQVWRNRLMIVGVKNAYRSWYKKCNRVRNASVGMGGG